MKKGKTPSLIGSGAGAVHFVQAGKKRPCHRCDGSIEKDTHCIEVRKPGTMGRGKTYCPNCFKEILSQTKTDLAKIERQFSEFKTASLGTSS